MLAAAAPTCRASRPSLSANRASRAIRASPRAVRQLRQRLRAAEEAEAAAATADNGVAAEASSSQVVVPLAASLVERAKIVVATGEVDEDFKGNFVTELETELQELQTRAQQAEASASALEQTLKATKDQFVRLTADFENFRRRSNEEKDGLRASVKGDTVMALVPLIDNFELAKGQVKPATEGEAKIDAAYQGLYKQMVELFRGLGVEAVPGVGSPFDPAVHDAIMREPSAEVPEDTVLEEFRKGFRLGEKLLRPAMVKVSFAPEGGAPAAVPDPDEGAASGESE